MMLEQFLSLKNLYSEYANLGKQVAHLIDLEDFDELQNILPLKDKILGHIVNQEKIVSLDTEQETECKKIKEEIALLEKENIERLTLAKDKIHKELTTVNKSANLHKAYTLYPNNTGDIIDSLE